MKKIIFRRIFRRFHCPVEGLVKQRGRFIACDNRVFLPAEPPPAFPAHSFLIALQWEIPTLFSCDQLVFFYPNRLKYGKGAEIPLIIFHRRLIFTLTTRPIDLSIAVLCSISGPLFSRSRLDSHGKFTGSTSCCCWPVTLPELRGKLGLTPSSSLHVQRPLFGFFRRRSPGCAACKNYLIQVRVSLNSTGHSEHRGDSKLSRSKVLQWIAKCAFQG